MGFLGLEKPIEYTGTQIFDPTMAKMVLDAQDKYFNVVYADYVRGLDEMKEFKKEYGDFLTPILADQEWYNQNVTGKIRNFIDQAYANGIDLTRSSEGRLAISKLINSIDIGSIAKLRSSAENAKEFLKARKQLEAAGLYNPILAKYDGPDIDTYSTLDRYDENGNVVVGSGIWDKMSPTRITDMATFGNPYFEGMKPNVHKESKNGITYSVESITPEDLTRIANDHFNELVSTPQGQLMYKYYVDTLGEDKARDAFNAAVAAGQSRRIYTKDDYDDNYYKAENLKLQRSSNDLAWQKFYWDKDKEQQELDIKRAAARGDSGGEGTQESGFSLAQRWYDAGLAKFLSSDGITKNWWDMADSYKDNASQIYDKAMKFGNKFTSQKPTTDDLMKYYSDERTASAVRNAINTPEDKRTDHQKQLVKAVEDKYYKEHSKYYNTNEIRQAFKQQYTIGMDTKSVAGAIGDTVSGNDRVVQATAANIDRLFGENDVITNTAGYRRKYDGADTKEIRDAINEYGASNTTITPLGDGYASLRKSGNFTVMPRVRITITDGNGNPVYQKDAYYDIGLSGMNNRGGAYAGNAKKHGGTIQYGSPVSFTEGPRVGYGYKGPIRFGESNVSFETRPEWYEGDFSIAPDYNRWTEYGGWDTRESSNLKASPTKKLGTY